VCDEQRFTSPPLPWKPKIHTEHAMDKLPVATYTKLLPPEEELHADLLAQYNVGSQAPPGMESSVNKLLLSPRGITPSGEVVVCNQCLNSLENSRMPKFAIANGSAPQDIHIKRYLQDFLYCSTIITNLTTQMPDCYAAILC
jgi:hypothetical protein